MAETRHHIGGTATGTQAPPARGVVDPARVTLHPTTEQRPDACSHGARMQVPEAFMALRAVSCRPAPEAAPALADVGEVCE